MPSRIIIRDIEPYKDGWAWTIIWPDEGDKVQYRTGEDARELHCLREDGSWWHIKGTDIDLTQVRNHAEARVAIRQHWYKVGSDV